ncbi:hypothetical protein A3770_10p59360 [Chloropicon primus]|uniref:Chalcone isomerase domain-containing protein n=2 Tax=Chloropicon primus TaxID=1764295 RepID=A0A5B8MRR8_9CHLO|nr:hypothetical protein A3770_10p59360 [Chloropicon primus]|eukprot:QDZ23418.1 hypothetical protein A3770_10p59360 [Chloropicon primus]
MRRRGGREGEGEGQGGEEGVGGRERWLRTKPASLALQLHENLKSKMPSLPWKGERARTSKGVIREVKKGGKKEPRSGMSFPGAVCLAGDRSGSSCVDLAGVGVRKKRLAGIAAITAYAVGVYLNKGDVARQKKGVFGDKKKNTPEKLLEGVLDGNRKNVIRLVVVFPRATGKQISKSLDDQIGDTLRRRGEGECFESFSKAFEGEKFRKGTVITLSSKNGTVTTFIDGRKKNAVHSEALNSELMNLYLGPATITQDCRQDTLSSLAGFL